MPTPRVVVECPLKFACTSRRWSDMEQTKSKHVRHCSTCAKDVFFVQSQAEWDQKVASGACVAIELHKQFVMGEPREGFTLQSLDDRPGKT